VDEKQRKSVFDVRIRWSVFTETASCQQDSVKNNEGLLKHFDHQRPPKPRLESLYCAPKISVHNFFSKCASRHANFKNLLSDVQFQNEAQVKLKCAIFKRAPT
jgi:hypothetical protein